MKILTGLLSVMIAAQVSHAAVINLVNGDFQADYTGTSPSHTDTTTWAAARFTNNQWYRSSGVIQVRQNLGATAQQAAAFLGNASNAFIEQKVVSYAIKSGSTYTVTFDLYKTSAANFSSVSVVLSAAHPSLNTTMTIGSVSIAASSMTADQWTSYTYTFTDANLTNDVNWSPLIRFQIPSTTATTGLYIDNVAISVTEVPEPAALSLLSLGLLPLLKKRK